MTIYAILIAGVLWGLSVGGSFLYGMDIGDDRKTAEIARETALRLETRELAQQGAAKAINGLEVKHTTINQEIQREVREKLVFVQCRSGPDGVRIYNSGVAGQPTKPAGSGKLPTKNPPP